MERAVDFDRDRRMRCGACAEEWTVDLPWLERWTQGDEACPACGTTCEAEHAARFTVRADDPALDLGAAKQLAWYHTSTHLNWPPTINFAATLDPVTKRRMGDVDQWARRQAAKALHVGTYESAIHNMLRRLSDQADHGNQFYLYRVHLKPETVMHPEWVVDPSNWLGDVHLDEICPPEVEALRYVNYHEDPGGLSVAIHPKAVGATRCIGIPLTVAADDPWVVDAVARLESDAPDKAPPLDLRTRRRRPLAESPRTNTAATVLDVLSDRLPANLRDQFEEATRWQLDGEPADWARFAAGLAALVEDPARVLNALDAQAMRDH